MIAISSFIRSGQQDKCNFNTMVWSSIIDLQYHNNVFNINANAYAAVNAILIGIIKPSTLTWT